MEMPPPPTSLILLGSNLYASNTRNRKEVIEEKLLHTAYCGLVVTTNSGAIVLMRISDRRTDAQKSQFSSPRLWTCK